MKQLDPGGFVAMRCEDGNRTQIITVRGEVDLASAPRLRGLISRAIGEANGDSPSVVVDLGAVEFVDTAGLEMLLERWNALRQFAGSMRLVVREGPVTRLLRLTGLDELFGDDLYPDLGAALRPGTLIPS